MPRDWLGRTSDITYFCRVGRKSLTQSVKLVS